MADIRLRGFLVIFELIQLIKLALVSLRRFMFSHTPREIREMTKPPYFEYPVGMFQLYAMVLILVMANLLWVCAVGLIYAPLAPLVAIGACLVFWFSSVVVSLTTGVDEADFSTNINYCMCMCLEPNPADACGTCIATV